MRHNSLSSSGERASRARWIRDRFLGWNSAALLASMLGASLVAVAPGNCSDADAPRIAIQPSVEVLDNKYKLQGNLDLEIACPPDGAWAAPDPTTIAQTITIVVASNSPNLPKYRVNAFPSCAGLSHKGPLKFVLNTGFVDDWDPKNKVNVEFSLPIKKNPPLPGLNGPFEQIKGKPANRGVYTDIFSKGNDTIPKEAVSKDVSTGWIGGYTVKIWSPNGGHLLGEVDPGVKVIDTPDLDKK